MKRDLPKLSFSKGVVEIAKIWLLVFLFVGAGVTAIQLFGAGIPLRIYPLIFLRAMFNPVIVTLYVLIVGLYALNALWLLRKHRASGSSEDA